MWPDRSHSGRKGPRLDPTLATEDVYAASNLILLCANHHQAIDVGNPEAFPVEALIEMKAQCGESRLGSSDRSRIAGRGGFWDDRAERGYVTRGCVERSRRHARARCHATTIERVDLSVGASSDALRVEAIRVAAEPLGRIPDFLSSARPANWYSDSRHETRFDHLRSLSEVWKDISAELYEAQALHPDGDVREAVARLVRAGLAVIEKLAGFFGLPLPRHMRPIPGEPPPFVEVWRDAKNEVVQQIEHVEDLRSQILGSQHVP